MRGARASSVDGFIQRIRSIEEIASALPGVSEAYAVKAGREVRVIVEPPLATKRHASWHTQFASVSKSN